jgi:3'(2'), 5'-bisphosphate nucleotidase
MLPLTHAMLNALRGPIASVLRWSGAIARQLRRFDIALAGKTSGNVHTDALTLADLTVQELLVAALRDCGDVFLQCHIEAEEKVGDLEAFNASGALTIALDPIDGTKQFRDRTGDGYGVLLHVRHAADVLYSLAYMPEMGAHGTWVEAHANAVRYGLDQPRQPAETVLATLPRLTPQVRLQTPNIYVVFPQWETERAQAVTQTGLHSIVPATMPGSLIPLIATGEIAGALIHSPNVYDFPIAIQIARILGGDAVSVHTGSPVHFQETWLDDRAEMIRLPGIVACAVDRTVLQTLVNVARDWSPQRYDH